MWKSARYPKIVCIALWLSGPLSAQTYFTSTLSTQDGLPSNKITCLAKSPKEFLWIGTDKGLVKLGQELMVCTVDHGLPSNKISALTAPDSESLWIGTSDNGISLMTGNEFENFSTKNGLANNQITKLYYSKRRQLLFVGTQGGLSVVKEKKISSFGFNGATRWRVTGFLENDTSVWVATQNEGWFYYNFATDNTLPLQKKQRCYERETNAVHVCPNGDTLISYNKNELKILSANKALSHRLDKRIIEFATTPSGITWTLANLNNKPGVNDICLLRNGELIPFGLQLSLTNSQLTSLLVDDTDGALIIGTKQKGVLIWAGFTFKRYETTPRCGTLHDVCEDDLGMLWLIGDQVMSFSPDEASSFAKKNLEETVKTIPSHTPGEPKFITPLNHSVVFGHKHKLFEINPSSAYKANATLSFGDSVTYIAAFNELILSLNHRQLNIFGKTDKKLKTSMPFQKEIQSTVELGQRIWILDKEKKLWCLNNKTFELNVPDDIYRYLPLNINKITKDRQDNLILEDDQGNIWIHNIETPSKTPTHNCIYNSEFIGHNILWFLCDKDNNLWMGTDMGLSMIDLNNFYSTGKANITNWGKGEGYASYESYKAIQARNGEIWVLSENKIMRFNPLEIEGIIRTPFIKLSSITIAGTSEESATKETSIDLNKQTTKTFKYKNNSLVFAFDVSNLLNKDRVMYQFKLSPGNTSWSAPSRQSFVYLSDLQPGSYTLTVKAWFQHAANNPATVSYSFIISQPWYLTIYANICYAVVVATILLVLFDLKIRMVKRKEAEKRKNTEKVALLKMESLQAQMNPHFIFNALNTLQYNILENNIDYSLEFLGEFSKLIRSTLDNASQHFISLKEELQYIENYIKVEQMRYSKNFYYSISLADGLEPSHLFIPPMIIQPHVENAIKYAFASSIGYIIISFSKIHDKLICMVEDNGIGRKQSLMHKKTHKSKGQSITSQRFEMLNQYYQKVNEYRYEIEDLHDEEGNPSGTRVTLYFPLIGVEEAMANDLNKHH